MFIWNHTFIIAYHAYITYTYKKSLDRYIPKCFTSDSLLRIGFLGLVSPWCLSLFYDSSTVGTVHLQSRQAPGTALNRPALPWVVNLCSPLFLPSPILWLQLPASHFCSDLLLVWRTCADSPMLPFWLTDLSSHTPFHPFSLFLTLTTPFMHLCIQVAGLTALLAYSFLPHTWLSVRHSVCWQTTLYIPLHPYQEKGIRKKWRISEIELFAQRCTGCMGWWQDFRFGTECLP